jgi:hypothetical protein
LQAWAPGWRVRPLPPAQRESREWLPAKKHAADLVLSKEFNLSGATDESSQDAIVDASDIEKAATTRCLAETF